MRHRGFDSDAIADLRARCEDQGEAVAVVLRGSEKERERCRLACQIAGTGWRSLVVLLVRQRIYGQTALVLQTPAEQLQVMVEMSQRRRVRAMLEEEGLRTQFSIFPLPNGRLRSSVAAAKELGCCALILPNRPWDSLVPPLRGASSGGLRVIEAGLGAR